MKHSCSMNLSFGFAAVLILMLGCGGSAANQSKKHLTAKDFYPLSQGSVWSHEVVTGEEPPTLAITKVVSNQNGQAVVQTATTEKSYELRDEGLFIPKDEVWLIKNPITVGTEWKSLLGDAKIVAVGTNAQGKHATYSECIVVQERDSTERRVVKTTYCADIGPVLVESSMQVDSQTEPVVVRGVLLGFELRR